MYTSVGLPKRRRVWRIITMLGQQGGVQRGPQGPTIMPAINLNRTTTLEPHNVSLALVFLFAIKVDDGDEKGIQPHGPTENSRKTAS